MKKIVVLAAALFLSLAGGAGPAAAVPQPVPTVDPLTECGDFIINVDITGKFNVIELPGGGVIVTSPGQTATLTNPENGKSVTYVITGVSKFEFLSDRIEVKATGRNVLTIPEGARKGVYLTIGNVNYALTADGSGQVRPFSGPGQVVDVCAVLR
jgi:hypothetical protein